MMHEWMDDCSPKATSVNALLKKAKCKEGVQKLLLYKTTEEDEDGHEEDSCKWIRIVNRQHTEVLQAFGVN
jgi:hypothetical protein